MLTKDEIIKRIERKHKIIREFGVNRLILVGSYAADQAKQDSDIDFLVSFDRKRGKFDDYIKLYHYLEDEFGKKIDLGEIELIRDEIKENIMGGKIEAKI